jgi:predicted nucleic acid-binding Zn ribbon protein
MICLSCSSDIIPGDEFCSICGQIVKRDNINKHKKVDMLHILFYCFFLILFLITTNIERINSDKTIFLNLFLVTCGFFFFLVFLAQKDVNVEKIVHILFVLGFFLSLIIVNPISLIISLIPIFIDNPELTIKRPKTLMNEQEMVLAKNRIEAGFNERKNPFYHIIKK